MMVNIRPYGGDNFNANDTRGDVTDDTFTRPLSKLDVAGEHVTAVYQILSLSSCGELVT